MGIAFPISFHIHNHKHAETKKKLKDLVRNWKTSRIKKYGTQSGRECKKTSVPPPLGLDTEPQIQIMGGVYYLGQVS